MLGETTYNYGDKWRVLTADNSIMRIFAHLPFQEEEMHVEFGSRGELRDRNVHVKRNITLECQMKSEGGKAIIQFDFEARTEGMNANACDGIIERLIDAVERKLGPGEPVKVLLPCPLPAPPWWLLGITGVTLVLLAGDAVRAITQ